MRIDFPYPDSFVEVPEANLMGVYALPEWPAPDDEASIVRRALEQPIGSPRLRDLAQGASSVLVVCDDVSRPTPAYKVLPALLEELRAGGILDEQIAFMMALGTHRPMTEREMQAKVGAEVYARYPVYNHEWDNPETLTYLGRTESGIEVWINTKVAEADLVVGVGRIMPIEVCGFTGGGKILIPGCCGEVTNSEMHWVRASADGVDVVGQYDNPIRAAIDSLARQAGLDFIVNIVMDARRTILDCVAGDLVEAHREGVRRCRAYHQVTIPHQAEIVLCDGYPFDIEFWQVNKAVDTAGLVVRPGGAVICVSPCYEGFSRTHTDVLLEYGYRPREEIVRLVASGQIEHKVVGVHMLQVGEVAVERATLYLVTDGICREEVEQVGLRYAPSPQAALDEALATLGPAAKVAVLRGAAEMLPVIRSSTTR
jgi:nickel-dependent lactate racemase